MNSAGIHHQFSCPYTPRNGVAGRKHLHIVETAISLLHHSSLPLSFWFEAIATAVYLINRMPSASSSNSSPYEILYHHPPDYTFLEVFGCFLLSLAQTSCSSQISSQIHFLCLPRVSPFSKRLQMSEPSHWENYSF